MAETTNTFPSIKVIVKDTYAKCLKCGKAKKDCSCG